MLSDPLVVEKDNHGNHLYFVLFRKCSKKIFSSRLKHGIKLFLTFLSEPTLERKLWSTFHCNPFCDFVETVLNECVSGI